MNKNVAQILMWAVTAALIFYAYLYARPILETSLASIFRMTLGGHIALAFDWYIRKRTSRDPDDPQAPLRMSILVGLGMVAGASIA